MLFETISIVLLVINSAFGLTDHSSCNWFGNITNVPLYPIDVCTAHSHETELDGLWLYSTKLQCDINGQLHQLEYNNTNCDGSAYNTVNYHQENGYYFNCQAKTSCPFVKVIFWDLDNSTNDHICAINRNAYHEYAIITNICMDMSHEYNASISYYIDCDANSMTYSEYIDTVCVQQSSNIDNTLIINEGCDDPFDMNAFVQISECDDANYNPIITPIPTMSTLVTTMPTQTPPITTENTVRPSSSNTIKPSEMSSVSPTLTPSIVSTFTPSMSTNTGDNNNKSDSSTSNGYTSWIVIVIVLCVIIVVLIFLVVYIICRQRKLKAEVLLNEHMNSVTIK